jgi:hypothetical protein
MRCAALEKYQDPTSPCATAICPRSAASTILPGGAGQIAFPIGGMGIHF